MAGTLTISTLSDGTNSTSSTNCIKGSAKAWVNYKGTSTQAITASYNVSSVTYNGTGDYTVNYTNAIGSTAYTVTCSAATINMSISTISSGSVRVLIYNGAQAASDYAFVGVVIHA